MPGTIEVTVMEFEGGGVSPKPFAKSLKVSVGRRHYQTSDKGDFSFPITKLGEDLIVALLDVGGNQIACADIRTMQIVEKGYWDEVFSMNGGGHVHLKLRFVLSEEERNRIRIMRESAVKKKLETNPNINLRLSETVSTTHETGGTITKNEHKVSDSPKGFVEIDVMRPTVNNSQAGSSLTSATSSADPLTTSYQKEGLSIPQSAIIPVKELSTNETDGSSQGTPYSSGKKRMKIESLQVHERKPEERSETQPTASSMFLSSSVLDKDTSVAPMSRYDPRQKSLSQGPQRKTPSNVKKMITAFENSKLQEVTSLKKSPSVPSQLNIIRKDTFPMDNSLKNPPSVPSQLNRFRKEQLHEDREPKVVMHVEDESWTTINYNMQQDSTTLTETVPSEAQKELKVNDSNSLSREQTVKELEKPTEDLTRQSASAIATTSGRMDEGQCQDTECDELYSETLNSYESSSVAEGSRSGRGTGLRSLSMVKFEVDSNPKRIALDEYNSAHRSGMWIFPGNTTRLCVTTAGKQVLASVGDPHKEAGTSQVNGNSSEPEVEEKNLIPEAVYTVENNQRIIEDQTKSRCSGSPDDSSNGLFGQVIRIAVILGFGVLVLLTRQREPRYVVCTRVKCY